VQLPAPVAPIVGDAVSAVAAPITVTGQVPTPPPRV
jgi:hypothetical protein